MLFRKIALIRRGEETNIVPCPLETHAERDIRLNVTTTAG
jgi:hypothetical protein